MKYQSIIGLEIHVQLKTKSKMFCRCSAETWNEPANSHTCPVCLGLPGALPVPNQKAIEQTLMIGLAINCQPQAESKFDRKNYFYPDLPKGYQISQYDLPFTRNGQISVNSKTIRITRVHLEEDTAKLIHKGGATLIDFNRSGIPLVEIVSEPDISSPEEAKVYAQIIQRITRYLQVSDADMEKGSLRIDANVSLSKEKGKIGTKVEIKNLNSFRALEKALNYEIDRQTELLGKRESITQQTRGWNEAKQKTYLQRSKEFAEDYRYFPEPDLPPLVIDPELIKRLRAKLPELPSTKINRYQQQLKLSVYDANILADNPQIAAWFEQAYQAYLTVSKKTKTEVAKTVANLVINELLRYLNKTAETISSQKILPAQAAELLLLTEEDKITHANAKEVFSLMLETGQSPAAIVATLAKKKIDSEEALQFVIEKVVAENQQAVADYKKGKTQSLSFLIGMVMRATSSKADPDKTRKILTNKLLQD